MIPGATGSTAKDSSTVTKTIAGARMKTGVSTNGGIQSSFMKILIESARTCSKPKGPTRFGP